MTFNNITITPEIKERAGMMLNELTGSRFEVVLIPAPEPKHSGHKIRAKQEGNPAWYSCFVAQYTNCRGIGRKKMKRPRTYIKKEWIVGALKNIIKGKLPLTPNMERLIRFIEHEKNIMPESPEEAANVALFFTKLGRDES